MSEKDRRSVGPEDTSTLNPAGAARRRLLKALGLTAVAGSVAIDWKRPAIRLGSTPLHAQPSPLSCDVAYSVSATIDPNVGGAMSMSLIGSDTGGSFLMTSDVLFDSGTLSVTTVTTGTDDLTLSAAVSWTLGDNASMLYTAGATCCTATASETRVNNDAAVDASQGFWFFIVDSDDGDCSVTIPS